MSERESERRRTSRRSRLRDHGIVSARVRPGYRAIVVDVSAGGVLIETEHRLLPGALVELHVETTTRRTTIRGRVLRCAVIGLRPSSVWYRGAIGFDRQLAWFSEESSGGYRIPGSGSRPAQAIRADATLQVV